MDGVTFRYYADARAALFDFESGVLDALLFPLTEADGRLRKNSDEILIQTDRAVLVYLRVIPAGLNPPGWHDAIKHAIDVDVLLQLQYGAKHSQRASIAFPLPYDRVKARRRFKHAN